MGQVRLIEGSARGRRCASLALSPLPLVFSYRYEKSLCGTVAGLRSDEEEEESEEEEEEEEEPVDVDEETATRTAKGWYDTLGPFAGMYEMEVCPALPTLSFALSRSLSLSLSLSFSLSLVCVSLGNR